jgi:predicted phage terminase large subunit-like protein
MYGAPIARRAPGEYLWDSDPDYPYGDFLRAQREAQLLSNWSALFQQRPAPEQGDYFKAEWFRPMTAMPARDRLAIYGASDYAVSAGRGDFTVHVVVGLDPDGQLYLLDLWRKQAATNEGVAAFLELCKRWKPIGWAQESGQISASIGPFLREQQRKHGGYVATETFPTKGDKAIRCQSIRGRLAVGGMLVPQAEWWPEVRAELLSFPAAKHDDVADAFGLIGQILDRMFAPPRAGAQAAPQSAVHRPRAMHRNACGPVARARPRTQARRHEDLVMAKPPPNLRKPTKADAERAQRQLARVSLALRWIGRKVRRGAAADRTRQGKKQ